MTKKKKKEHKEGIYRSAFHAAGMLSKERRLTFSTLLSHRRVGSVVVVVYGQSGFVQGGNCDNHHTSDRRHIGSEDSGAKLWPAAFCHNNLKQV